MIDVSVIIGAYNATDYLAETVDSVLNQSYKNLELILVDDGSTDATYEMMQKYEKQDSRVKIFTKKNTGATDTKNFGYTKSSGEYLSFLDADDVLVRDCIEKRRNYLIEHENAALVYSSGRIINERSEIVEGKFDYNMPHLKLDDILQWKDGSIPCPSSTMFRRTQFEEIGCWDSTVNNSLDQDIYIRFSSRYDLGYIDEYLYQYRVHPNQMHRNIKGMERDHLRTFNNARTNGLFKSKRFENYCYSNLYMILAKSWWVNGNNKIYGIKYALLSFFKNPKKLFGEIFKLIRG